MRPLYPLATLLVTGLSPINAHWTYNRLIVNGAFMGEPYEYIRQPQNGNNFLSDVNSTDMRCNVGCSSGRRNNTATAPVHAGDVLGFGIADTFGHPGIQQVYLSRAPDLPLPSSNSSLSAAAVYDGSGGWARIYALTTTPTQPNGTGTLGKNSFPEAQPGAVDWATHGLHDFLFKLPSATPAGEYLLRAEGLALHAAHKRGGAQFYVACAQIRVVNDDDGGGSVKEEGKSSAALGPLVNIPGVYRGDEPGVLIPQFWSALTRYTTPGPGLWPPGTTEMHIAEHL
ncbi:lytic polysaccharide monooxygenase [Xylaria arbuscula]|nr:lytic polysaccharide monooxygenase [Xylaria arbuscula]